MSPKSRVLVVEDEPTARAALRDLLEAEGFAVDTAARGHEALACQRSTAPDLILADLGLPDLDGLVVARITRTETGCAVLLMTGSERDLDEVLEFDLVKKPIDFDMLLHQIHCALADEAR